MNESWLAKKLDGFVRFRHGKSIKAGTDGAYPVYGSNGIIGSSDSFMYEDAIIIGRVGAYCGSVERCFGRFWASDNTIVVEVENEVADYQFVYYLLLDARLNQYAGGAAQPLLTQSRLKPLEFLLPPLSTQQRIAAILSAYDDLIENNTRRIAILEEMARRLYEEWFVHFRFPGYEAAEFIERDGKSFPVGWQQKELKQVVKRLKNGTVYKQKDVLPSGSTIVVDQSRAEYLGFHDGTADHEASVASPIIIFGDHTCKMQIMIVPFSLGPNTIAFTSAEGQGLYYLFGLVQGNVETKEYKRHWTELSKKKVRVANVDLAVRYDETVRPIFAMMEMLRQKNRNLRAQRDLLLPKLVSGEIDVSEAEAGLEAAE